MFLELFCSVLKFYILLTGLLQRVCFCNNYVRTRVDGSLSCFIPLLLQSRCKGNNRAGRLKKPHQPDVKENAWSPVKAKQ